MRKIATLLVLILLSTSMLDAQDIKAYTTAQAHSHNDYERKGAFQEAYDQQFGSLEADLFLVNDTLFVAHNLKDIHPKRTLNTLYIQPILASVEKNGGSIYAQKDVPLQFLIDLKTGAERWNCPVGDTYIAAMAFSPDDKLLATTARPADEARLWELPSGRPLATLKGHV